MTISIDEGKIIFACGPHTNALLSLELPARLRGLHSTEPSIKNSQNVYAVPREADPPEMYRYGCDEEVVVVSQTTCRTVSIYYCISEEIVYSTLASSRARCYIRKYWEVTSRRLKDQIFRSAQEKLVTCAPLGVAASRTSN